MCFGYKIWTLASVDGAGLFLEPYCGRDTNVEDRGMGQGPNIVVDLVLKGGLVLGSEVYTDNLFTSFPLLKDMSDREIGLTGTMC